MSVTAPSPPLRLGLAARHGEPGEAAALAEYARTRDPRLRELLVERYLPLARFAASRFSRRQESFDDLVQVASMALVKALDRYDPDKARAFSSYAMPTMLGELRRHFRDHGWAVRPPRGLQEQALLVDDAVSRLERERGRAPTVDEVAGATGLDVEDVLEAMQALGGRHASSLDAKAVDGEDQESTLVRRLGEVDDGFDRAEARATIDRLARVLSPRDREVLRLRFEEDLTQAEIGRRVGLSQMHVSRIVRDALEKLRGAAEAEAA